MEAPAAVRALAPGANPLLVEIALDEDAPMIVRWRAMARLAALGVGI